MNDARDPIDRLLAEHRELMAQFERLRRALDDLHCRGDAARQEALATLAAVSQVMKTELVAHARREDQALFPALEAVFGAVGTPTAVMREEHRGIHDRAGRFRATLAELNQVEHPAIVAGGERLRALTREGGSAAELHAIGFELLGLIELHFAKEEDILFPMAREVLAPAALREVALRMDVLDRSAS
jgi:iron-sulfur cluster repair protein YtfE (RIC family)